MKITVGTLILLLAILFSAQYPRKLTAISIFVTELQEDIRVKVTEDTTYICIPNDYVMIKRKDGNLQFIKEINNPRQAPGE